MDISLRDIVRNAREQYNQYHDGRTCTLQATLIKTKGVRQAETNHLRAAHVANTFWLTTSYILHSKFDSGFNSFDLDMTKTLVVLMETRQCFQDLLVLYPSDSNQPVHLEWLHSMLQQLETKADALSFQTNQATKDVLTMVALDPLVLAPLEYLEERILHFDEETQAAMGHHLKHLKLGGLRRQATTDCQKGINAAVILLGFIKVVFHASEKVCILSGRLFQEKAQRCCWAESVHISLIGVLGCARANLWTLLNRSYGVNMSKVRASVAALSLLEGKTEGWLKKKSPSIQPHPWQSRYFVLEKSMMTYWKTGALHARGAEPIGVIMCADIKEVLEGRGQFFDIVTATNRKYQLQAPTALERSNWVEALKTSARSRQHAFSVIRKIEDKQALQTSQIREATTADAQYRAQLDGISGSKGALAARVAAKEKKENVESAENSAKLASHAATQAEATGEVVVAEASPPPPEAEAEIKKD